MANTKSNGESGCFSAILRCLLCRDGAPMHPADPNVDPALSPIEHCDRNPKDGSKLGEDGSLMCVASLSGRRVGVVARLMGLETLPNTKWVPSLRSSDVFSRSRSVNFMDYLLEVDFSSSRRAHGHHRRVRSSVSFREVPLQVPTLLPRPKEKDLIVVILENRDKEEEREKKRAAKSRKHEVRRKKSDRTTKERKVSKLRDEPRSRSRLDCNNKSSCSRSKVRYCDMDGHHYKARKSQRKDKKQKQAVVECGNGSDSSSPVSVLDQFECHLQEHRVGDFAPGRASPPSKVGSHSHDSASMPVVRILDPIICPKERSTKKKQMEFPEDYKCLVEDVVGRVYRLAEQEAGNGNSRWLSDSSDFEEISLVIGHHVLDCLLEEVVGFSP